MQKHFLPTAFLAALTLTFVSMAPAEELENGSFETGDIMSWINPGDPASVVIGAPAVGAQDGSFAAEIALAPGVGEVRQIFPANPGEEFRMSGYILTEAVLPEGPTFGLFKIVFRDAAGNDLPPESISVGQPNADFPGVESLPFLNADMPTDEWVFSEARGVAPANTVEVLYLALNVDFAGGINPMWFDNIEACQVIDDKCLLGDVNQDGIVSLLDVGPFVNLLVDGGFQCEADFNGDGLVTLLDVEPFINLLNGG